MQPGNAITVVGNLTDHPEFRPTRTDGDRTRLRIAVSRRIRSSGGDGWENHLDGYFTVTVWGGAARNAVRSLHKGDRVVVSGRLVRRTFEVPGEDGPQKRSAIEINADEVGPSLRWHAWARIRDEDGSLRPPAALDSPPDGSDGDGPGDEADDHTVEVDVGEEDLTTAGMPL